MKIHVCLVSDQMLANLIPALMERPDRVVLVVTQGMKRRSLDERLKTCLNAKGISSEVVEDAPDTGLDEIRRYAGKLLDTLCEAFPGSEVTLNATGGTKLMTLGFVSSFDGCRVIYTDTAHRRIELVGRETRAALPMTDVLDVPNYLAAQGMRYSHADSDDADRSACIEARRIPTRFMGQHIKDLQGIVKVLNGIIGKAVEKNVLTQPTFTFKQEPYGAGKKLMGHCVDFGLLEWDGKTTGKFVDLGAARYLGGGWLEEYAWLSVGECRPFDFRLGVHRIGENDAEINEFDVLAVHCNQLLFIECKTANYRYEIGKANEAAYKVDSLSRQARGLFGETWLLSAIEPPPELVERTRDARIRLIGPDDLPRLRETVQAWMRH